MLTPRQKHKKRLMKGIKMWVDGHQLIVDATKEEEAPDLRWVTLKQAVRKGTS